MYLALTLTLHPWGSGYPLPLPSHSLFIVPQQRRHVRRAVPDDKKLIGVDERHPRVVARPPHCDAVVVKANLGMFWVPVVAQVLGGSKQATI
jgi:hypothetical protein